VPAGALGGFARRLEDGARLHFGDLGIGERQPAATKTQHWIELVELASAIGELLGVGSRGGGDFGNLFVAMG